MNPVEDLTEMSRADKQELRRRMAVLLEHKLKLEHLPTLRGHNEQLWQQTLNTQRRDLATLFGTSPGLRSELRLTDPEKLYAAVRRRLCDDYPNVRFPDNCPYRVDEILGL
jgi:hypothetical protein